MRIAVDVMGGDHGCGVILDGVIQALDSLPSVESAVLVGKEDEINKVLAKGPKEPTLDAIFYFFGLGV